MKQNILTWSLVLLAYLAVFGLVMWNTRDVTRATSNQVSHGTPTLDHQQKAWLGALEWCESRGNPKAVNPKDRDNTPSYGLLQFKPGTFYGFAKKYGIATTSLGYMDPEVQEAIVTQMILRGGIDWSWQFPACTKRLGPPPS